MRWALFLALVTAEVFSSPPESGTANFYQNSPHDYVGKKIRLRVSSVSPAPELTASDPGFVWMEAVTGHPKKEQGSIFLRIPAADSAKVAKRLNTPTSSGHWLVGLFFGHESGAVLSETVTKKAPFYVQVMGSAESGSAGHPEDLETSSGSLVVAPSAKTPKASTPSPENYTPPARPGEAIPQTSKLVLYYPKPGAALQVRAAQQLKAESDFYEIKDQAGLTVIGRALVVAVLPLPEKDTTPAKDEVAAAMRLYAEQAQKTPEAVGLLHEAKASWEKLAGVSATTTASLALPEMEDVETAAGSEEPESGYPLWFGWATGAGISLLIFLGWAWSRPRSTSA